MDNTHMKYLEELISSCKKNIGKMTRSELEDAYIRNVELSWHKSELLKEANEKSSAVKDGLIKILSDNF